MPVHRALVVVFAVLATACGTPAERSATPAREVSEADCVAALRDIRTWCSDGLLDAAPERHYNCLEARLRFDRLCLPQRE